MILKARKVIYATDKVIGTHKVTGEVIQEDSMHDMAERLGVSYAAILSCTKKNSSNPKYSVKNFILVRAQ